MRLRRFLGKDLKVFELFQPFPPTMQRSRSFWRSAISSKAEKIVEKFFLG